MNRLLSFDFPDMPPELNEILFADKDKKLVVIGVIGKSSFPDCNKMVGFDIFDSYPQLEKSIPCKDGKITFYFKQTGDILYIHFQTTFDNFIYENLLEESSMTDNSPLQNMVNFNSYVRTRFGKILLFAIQICHIVVLVETRNVFDAAYLSIFKSLKIIREKYVLKFLPKLLKNSNAGSFMGKEGRLCSPRFLFFFERCFHGIGEPSKRLEKYEFEIEDSIYKVLRNEFIITNNTSLSLFSIPRNKRFVYFNTDRNLRSNPILESAERLAKSIQSAFDKEENEDDILEDLRPFKGFAKPLVCYNTNKPSRKVEVVTKKRRSFVTLLEEHVAEAIESGFDDSMSRYRGKSHFVIPAVKSWFETFKILHKIFIENPDNPSFEANDPDYKSYLDNFHKIMDIDERFFLETCEYGLELAVNNYNELLPHHYSTEYHSKKLNQSIDVLMIYARGSQIEQYVSKLKEVCETIWMNGKQQCEYPSLRGNLCSLQIHTVSDPSEHSSNVIFISTCNCGHTQAHRNDPFTIRQANYEFYNIVANSCKCNAQMEHIKFPVFEPSGNDYRPAEIDKRLLMLDSTNYDENSLDSSVEMTDPSMNLSFRSISDINKTDEYDGSDSDDYNNSVNEIIIKVGATQIDNTDKNNILRQPSTTEYLPGMVHSLSPIGLLPQFPSWSLVCIGASSVYSHNTGLPEHMQGGFLSGANYLLPWDINVRLENVSSWVTIYEKQRFRKKPQIIHDDTGNNGKMFMLKIFIGCEYECPRGHRFMLNSPDQIIRGGSGIVWNSASNIVYNDMPLYFPCPCKGAQPRVAQLMRIHVVTPKAPVNILINPKIRTGGKNPYIFVTGLGNPIKLTQSAYWILRLPYIYQGDDGSILPPNSITVENSLTYGCLLGGMYGVTETEDDA